MLEVLQIGELTVELAYNLGRAGAYVLTETAHKPKILVGMDNPNIRTHVRSTLVAGDFICWCRGSFF